MGRFAAVFAVICLLVAGVITAGVLTAKGYSLLPRAPEPKGDCTAQAPCEIHILFAYTTEGARVMTPSVDFDRAAVAPCIKTGRAPSLCVLDRVAMENVAALSQAFLTSGITDVAGGKPNIVFTPPEVMNRPLDEGASMRLDTPANYSAPAEFNRQLLGWLPEARPLRARARRVNLVVVYSGMRGAGGTCFADSVQNNGYIVMSACLVNGYASVPQIALDQQLLFLHEAGHLFGAYHNDNGNPQPCSAAAASGKDPRGCAWEQCTDRVCTTEELATAPDAFCTLVGQYNYMSAGPFCRAHRKGERGSGWIREYSHPGKCRLAGYERYDCGDANHDAVSVMRTAAFGISRRRPKT